MDELYTESFFTSSGTLLKKESPIINTRTTIPEPVREIKKEKSPVQAPAEKPSGENYEIAHQMGFYMDQLEKALFQEFENSSDFRFILSKIREKLRDKKTDGIYELLTELEELMELS